MFRMDYRGTKVESKEIKKLIQVREAVVTDEMLVGKVVWSGPNSKYICILIDIKGSTDGINTECTRKRGVKDDSRLWGRTNQKNGVFLYLRWRRLLVGQGGRSGD